jgi:hypothetical protein
MGRFLTPDPYMASTSGQDPAGPGTWNRYAYVIGDPINWVDHSGMNYTAPEAPTDPGGCVETDILGCVDPGVCDPTAPGGDPCIVPPATPPVGGGPFAGNHPRFEQCAHRSPDRVSNRLPRCHLDPDDLYQMRSSLRSGSLKGILTPDALVANLEKA